MDVVVIGAGMAGLCCAELLTAQGHAVRVFDKGRGPGGRMATRRMEVDGQTLQFDHGTPFFDVRDAGFAARVAEWEAAGVVARWPAAGADAWVGTPAMNAPVRAMADRCGAVFGARAERLERDGSGCQIAFEDGATVTCEAAIVAFPAEQAGVLLADTAPDFAARARGVVSDPCWTLMAHFAERVPVEADLLATDAALNWAIRNGAKPGRDTAQECWVIQAGADWSRRHLEDPREEVADRLLAAFAERAGCALPTPIAVQAHRWRYSQVRDAGKGPLWDAKARIGACGDWLTGGDVEGAFLSGSELAKRIGSA